MVEQCILDVIESLGDLPLILFGDFNARTGNENSDAADTVDCGFDIFGNSEDAHSSPHRVSKDTVVNDFGRYLLNVCTEFDLTILNGSVDGSNIGNYTYISPTGCSVVDYFVASKTLLSLSLRLNVGQRIESKHMPVELLIESNNTEVKRSDNRTKLFKIEKFQWDEEKRSTFMEQIASPYVLNLIREATDLIDVDINESLLKFLEGLQKAGSCMKKTITIGKGKAQAWFDAECRVTRKDLRHHLRKYHKGNTDIERLQYNQKRREYKELLRVKKAAYRKKVLDSLHCASTNSAEFWGKLKSYIGKKSETTAITKEEWFDHFSKIFDPKLTTNSASDTFCEGDTGEDCESTTVEEEFDVLGDVYFESLEGDITEAEVYTAVRALKNGKAAGPDGITGEFFKHSATFVVPFLVKFFNRLFTTGSYPQAWSEAIIHPLLKKGDANNPDNYRGISLLNICSKLYSHILNNRLNKWIEENEILDEFQAGFRKNYNTIDHLFTIDATIQKQLSYHRKLFVAFVDFRKAFDSVVRKNLWKILRKNGVNGKMFRAITSMYNVVKAKVRAGGDLTESFMCPSGLKQGEVCSPVLFSLFINELAREIVQRGRHGIQLIPDLIEIFILLFADDVILMSDSVCGLQNQLNILYETANRLGLVVNLDKSNIVVFRNGGHIAWNEKWFYGQSLISVVNVYKYLGICLSTRLTFSHALKDMAARAKIGVVNILKLLWSLGEKSPSIFFKLFDVQIQPILNYGAEVWGLEADLKVVERIHLFALKRFLNVSSRTPNVMVYGETGRYPLFVNIFVKSVKYWLRILKIPDHRFPYKSYKMLLYLHEQNRKTWASSVCFLLYKYGFNHVWENQGVGDEKTFLKEFKN